MSTSARRLFSADSHCVITSDQVKKNLASGLHADWDAGMAKHDQMMSSPDFMDGATLELEDFVDLEAARHPGAGAATGKQGDHGQGKAGSFAGACLGDSQDVLAFKGRGDRAGLNWRGGFIPGLINGFQDFRIKV